MNVVHNLIGIILLTTTILGCTIAGEPRKHWDLQTSKEDMELTIKKHQARTPEERQYYEDRRNDLNYKWHIELDNHADDVPSSRIADKNSDQAINQLIDKALREGTAKSGQEKKQDIPLKMEK